MSTDTVEDVDIDLTSNDDKCQIIQLEGQLCGKKANWFFYSRCPVHGTRQGLCCNFHKKSFEQGFIYCEPCIKGGKAVIVTLVFKEKI